MLILRRTLDCRLKLISTASKSHFKSFLAAGNQPHSGKISPARISVLLLARQCLLSSLYLKLLNKEIVIIQGPEGIMPLLNLRHKWEMGKGEMG